MKIIFVNRYFFPDYSATSQILSDLTFHLGDAGREVHAVTSRQRYEKPSVELAAEENVRGVSVHRVAGTRFGRANLAGRAIDYASFYFAARARVEELVLPGDVVVAKTDPPMLGAALEPIARRCGGVLVNWLQDVFPEVGERAGIRVLRGPVAAALRTLRDRALAGAAANVVVGARMAEYLASSCSVAPERIRVIHNWADGELIRPIEPDGNMLRRDWGLEGKFVVGYSGNLGRVHEHETMLGAMRRLKVRDDIRFVFIGGGYRLDRLRGAARAEGLGNVLFQPYQERERLAQSLSVPDAHLCVLRPEFEGLVVPSKFYGIAAAGRPTVFVGDPDGEIPRVLAKHDIGITVRPGRTDDLAAALLELQADPERRLAMGARARAVFEAEYDKPIAMAKWEAVLRQVGEPGETKESADGD